MSLRVRIALISAAAVAIAIAIAALVTYNATERELIAEVDASLYLRVEQVDSAENPLELLAALSPFDGGRTRGPFERGESGFDAIFWQFFIRDGSGITQIDLGGDLPVGAEEESVINGDVTHVVRTVSNGDDNLRILTSNISIGTAQVARSLAEVDSSLAGLAAVLKMAAVVGVLLAGVVGYLVSRGAARPIGQLAEAAEYVAETQHLEARIDVQRNDEVGRLAESFNSMLAALQSSREQQRRLVHDAGHELRTPLTAIRTNVELLSKMGEIPAEERAQMMADVDSEIQELTQLVAELVDLAAEPPSEDVTFDQLDLGELVERVADKYRRRTNRSINVADDHSQVIGQAGQLERAVSNLIDNAAKWSPPSSPIEVTVADGRVAVADLGPGIDADDRPFVFDRFYRATKDRSTPGSGLGLSIVAKVAADHGGTAFVEDVATGAVVGFQVPLIGADGAVTKESQAEAR